MKKLEEKWDELRDAVEAGLITADQAAAAWAEFLARTDVPAADRVWVATRPLTRGLWSTGVVPAPTLRRWLGLVCRRALGRETAPDPRSLAVLSFLDRGAEVPPVVVGGAYAAYYDRIGAFDNNRFRGGVACAARATNDDLSAAEAGALICGILRDAAKAAAFAAGPAWDDAAWAKEREQQVEDLRTLLTRDTHHVSGSEK